MADRAGLPFGDTADFEAATREVDALYARWAELEEIAAH